jgi:GNAT superfamily N-acetyltransferase
MDFKEVTGAAGIECLVTLVQEIWPEVFVPLIGADQVDYMLAHYQGRDAIAGDQERGIRYFLVTRDGGVIGYFAYALEEDRLFISKIYLKKEYRGLGLASGIFRHLEDLARENRKARLFLRVNRLNTNAVDVYLHRGFKITGSVDEPLGERFFLNDYLMEKAIQPGPA